MGYAKPFAIDDPNHKGSLEELAAVYASRPAAEAEALIEGFCAEAVSQWRLQDATFWQRVKFRARMLRAMRSPDGDVGRDDLGRDDLGRDNSHQPGRK